MFLGLMETLRLRLLGPSFRWNVCQTRGRGSVEGTMGCHLASCGSLF